MLFQILSCVWSSCLYMIHAFSTTYTAFLKHSTVFSSSQFFMPPCWPKYRRRSYLYHPSLTCRKLRGVAWAYLDILMDEWVCYTAQSSRQFIKTLTSLPPDLQSRSSTGFWCHEICISQGWIRFLDLTILYRTSRPSGKTPSTWHLQQYWAVESTHSTSLILKIFCQSAHWGWKQVNLKGICLEMIKSKERQSPGLNRIRKVQRYF